MNRNIAVVGAGINKTFRGKAYNKVNNASKLTPFLYTAIIFSGLLDWMVYNVVPDYLSIIGATLIMGSGFILYLSKPKQRTRDLLL